MTTKICRLCFKRTAKPIGIYSSRGIHLNIAELLQLHFSDEVDEYDEEMPQSVCLDCWIKTKYFHEFYTAAIKAKDIFLENLAKAKEPTFMESDCNSPAQELGIPYLEVVPLIENDASSEQAAADNGFEVEHVMLQSHELYDETSIQLAAGDPDETENAPLRNDVFVANTAELPIITTYETEHGLFQNNELMTYDPHDDLAISDVENDEIEFDASVIGSEPIIGGDLTVKEAASLAKKVNDKSSKEAFDEFMKLIPHYFDMICELCKYEFKSLNEVFRHYRYQHDNAKINVKCCLQPVNSADLRDHILNHLHPDLYKCNKCEKRFTLGRQYRLHAQTHQRLLLKCDICKKDFSCKRGIIKHMVTVHGRNKGRFECDICNKRFNAKSTMQAHVKIEHENHRQVCHVCAKEYRTLHSLQLHLRSHSNKGPRLKCRTCGNMFMNMYRLRLHQAQEHEHAKLLQCPHCPRKKTNTFELRKHITHSHKFKVHKCELCEREFRSPIDVQRHMKIHIRGELIKCDYCPKQYTQQRDSTKHMKAAHPIEWGSDPNRLAFGK